MLVDSMSARQPESKNRWSYGLSARFPRTQKGFKTKIYPFSTTNIQMEPKMRVMQFAQKGGNLELAHIPIPTPGDEEVRIKIHFCGICHGDIVQSKWIEI